MDDRLIRRAVEVNWRNLALGHDVFDADGGTFVRNHSLPSIYDANFVFAITASAPAEIERLLRRASREYSHTARLTFRVDPFTPLGFEARLAFDGYQQSGALVMLLDGAVRREAPPIDVRPIDDEAAWQAFAKLKLMDWHEYAGRVGEDLEDVRTAQGLAASSRLKCPPVRYVLAYENGQAVAHCNAWKGLDGIGQVEDLFVHPGYRHRGIATALIRHSVDIARSDGAGSMVIVVDPANTAKEMYSALGWQPVVMCRQYSKQVRTS